MAQNDTEHGDATRVEVAELEEAVRVQGEMLRELIDGVRMISLFVLSQCDRFSQDR